MPIVPGPADTGQRTHPFDPIMIALPLHLRLDHRVDGVSPGSPVFRRRSLTCRKAARKKSRSSCCWPIFRSNSAIRLSETVASDDGAADTSSNRRELFNGRPISRSAAAPPDRYFRRHSYSRSRPTPSSAASAATLTVSSSRDSARSLNSRVHRVLVFDTLVLLREQCASFPCLSSGVHSWGSLHGNRAGTERGIRFAGAGRRTQCHAPVERQWRASNSPVLAPKSRALFKGERFVPSAFELSNPRLGRALQCLDMASETIQDRLPAAALLLL